MLALRFIDARGLMGGANVEPAASSFYRGKAGFPKIRDWVSLTPKNIVEKIFKHIFKESLLLWIFQRADYENGKIGIAGIDGTPGDDGRTAGRHASSGREPVQKPGF